MPAPKIVTLRNESEYKCIDLTDLLYVSVYDYLSSFHSVNNQKFTCTKSLLEVVSMLPDNFFRINRNHIVNIHAIDTFKLSNRKVHLSNSVEFIVSYRRIKQLQIELLRCNLTITG
jgi:DNA-binding LytR/AlgR family response regulator